MAGLVDDAESGGDLSSVVYVGESGIHGRGLFAARDFAAGEAVAVEAPLVAQQDVANKHEVLCCGACLSPVDAGVAEMGALARGETTRREVFEKLRSGTGVATCSCGEVYCDDRCLAAHAAQGGHAALCVGAVADAAAAGHPLVRFKVLAVQSNEILLLAADALARCLSDGAAALGDEGLAAAADRLYEERFGCFTGVRWPDVVSQTHELRGGDPMDVAALRRKLAALCFDAAALLAEAFEPHFGQDAARRLATPERLERLIGTFEQNNIGIRADVAVDETKVVLEAAGEERSGVTIEGTALYSRACCANHSCAPNVKLLYPAGAAAVFRRRLAATLVALEPIKRGDELTISYIEAHRRRSRRRAETANYGFLCQCPRCAAAESDDNEDVDDDEDDEEDDWDTEEEEDGDGLLARPGYFTRRVQFCK